MFVVFARDAGPIAVRLVLVLLKVPHRVHLLVVGLARRRDRLVLLLQRRLVLDGRAQILLLALHHRRIQNRVAASLHRTAHLLVPAWGTQGHLESLL